MQLHATMIPVRKQFTEKSFVELVLRWNRQSETDRMDGVVWDGRSAELSCREDGKSLEITSLPERRILAARYQRRDEKGVVWTTDLVLNQNEQLIVLSLDRESSEAGLRETSDGELHPWESLYTWEGVLRAKFAEQNEVLRQSRARLCEENQDLCDTFEEQLREYEETIAEQERRIQALELENQGLRQRAERSEKRPLLHVQASEELYEGEFRDLVLDVFLDYLKGQNPDSRRSRVLREILKENGPADAQEERRNRIKQLLKGYSGLPGSLRRELEEFGFTVTSEGRHYKLSYHNDPRCTIVMAKTCSDTRAGNNLAAQIVRDML